MVYIRMVHLNMKENAWLKKTLMLSLNEVYETSADNVKAVRNARDEAQIQSPGRKYSTKLGYGLITVKRTA